MTPAALGKFVPNFGALAATPAGPGHYVPFPGMSAQIPASPGYYAPGIGGFQMFPALAGTYVATNAATAPTLASIGSYAPVTGMQIDIPAAPGYYVSITGSSAMTPAPIGTIVPLAGSTLPTPVTPGTYAPIIGMQSALTSGDLSGDNLINQAELDIVLANYWTNSPWIFMTNAAQSCGGNFQFTLTNASAWDFSVLVSTNLGGTNWNYLTVAHPIYQFADAAATNGAPQRFYRLRWP
jgi:hypothetical protein